MEDKKQNLKIIVACHKADPNIRQNDIYMPIQVGKALHPDLDLGFQCDNTGDNISEKNGSYCELTALYWAWKNLKNIDYIGLCHYRRYFCLSKMRTNIFDTLSHCDGIVLEYRKLSFPVISDISGLLTLEDTAIMLNELFTLYPEYRQSAIKYFLNSNGVSQCNMFILPWDKFDEYCKFIFPLLEQIESKVKIHAYTRLKRNIGYMAECLQGLYFMHNQFNLTYLPKEEIRTDKVSRNKLIFRNVLADIKFILRRKQKDFKVYDSVRVGLNQDGISIDRL